MAKRQGTPRTGVLWIVEDDQEVALALWKYLAGHITPLETFELKILSGPEMVPEQLDQPGEEPQVVLVGTDQALQAALDVAFALKVKGHQPLPLIIALGPDSDGSPNEVVWEMWPAASETALADRIRNHLFSGPQPTNSP